MHTPRHTMHTSEDTTDTERFDYNVNAELFSAKGGSPRRQPLGYKRFACAAEAIRFAMEDLPQRLFPGTSLVVDEVRYASAEIRRLYESSHYPLTRRAAGRLA